MRRLASVALLALALALALVAPVAAQEAFVVSGGKIASLVVNIGVPTEAAQAATTLLPATGGAFAALGGGQVALVALAALPLLAKRK